MIALDCVGRLRRRPKGVEGPHLGEHRRLGESDRLRLDRRTGGELHQRQVSWSAVARQPGDDAADRRESRLPSASRAAASVSPSSACTAALGEQQTRAGGGRASPPFAGDIPPAVRDAPADRAAPGRRQPAACRRKRRKTPPRWDRPDRRDLPRRRRARPDRRRRARCVRRSPPRCETSRARHDRPDADPCAGKARARWRRLCSVSSVIARRRLSREASFRGASEGHPTSRCPPLRPARG